MIQKVELYYDASVAKDDMERHIKNGWKVRTCTISTRGEHITSCIAIVVYER